MSRTGRLAALVWLALAVLSLSATVHAQSWPNKPIKFVVPFPPAGGNDILARVVSEKLAPALGQPIIIDNRPGAGGNIGADFVAKCPADGYTFLIAANAILTTNQHLYAGKLPYDPLKDFEPVGLLGVLPVVLAVNADVPAKNVQELIALAKSKPDDFVYASAGPGTPHHLAAEMFKSLTGAPMLLIPYKGGAPAATDLIAGRVQVMFAPINNVTPYLEGGRVRLLGVGSEKRIASRPDLPTIAEAGVPGFFVDNWIAIVAPAGTPKDVVATMSAELAKVLAQPEVQSKFAVQGIEPASATPAQLGETIRAESVRWGAIIKNAGIKLD
jgi:tripartite-type tricarboxylate transporter receptor subunit TctC